MQSPTSFCRKLPTNLQKGIDISISTVSRRLSKELRLKSCKPAAKPRLTSVMKKKRLSFANKHLHWTMKNEESYNSPTNPLFIVLCSGKEAFLKTKMLKI